MWPSLSKTQRACPRINYYIFWVCVCGLPCPKRKEHAHELHCHLWPVRLYNIFPHYLIKARLSQKKVTDHKTCVFWFSLQITSETLFVLGTIQRDMIKNVHWSSCKVPVILVWLQWNLEFLDICSKNIQISNFKKICPVGDELSHADRQTRQS
jgi:hypothetical protein